LITYLGSIGTAFGPDLNAQTTFDRTVYTLEISTKDPTHLTNGIKVLADWAGYAKMEEDAINSERNVIMDELRRGGSPHRRLIEKWLQASFPDSLYANRLPTGLEKVITHSPPEDLRRFYRDWYRPDRMGIIAVGDINDLSQFKASLLENFSPLKNPETLPVEPPPPQIRQLKKCLRFADPELTLSSFILSYNVPDDRLPENELWRNKIINELVTHSINQRLKQINETANSKLLSTFYIKFNIINSVDTNFIGMQLKPDSSAQAIFELITEVQRLAEHGLTEEELLRAKKTYYQSLLQASLSTDTEKSKQITDRCLSHFLGKEPLLSAKQTLDLYNSLIDTIETKEIQGRLSSLSPKKAQLAILQLADLQEFKDLNEEKVLELIDTGSSQTLTPYYEEPLSADSLITEKLNPVLPTGKVNHDTVGAHELLYPNGVRLIYKQMDKEKNSIYAQAFTPIGTASLSPEELPALYLLSRYITHAGAGPFTETQLNRFLSGKPVSFSSTPHLHHLTNTFTCGTADLQTMLERFYSVYTSLRMDPTAFVKSKQELVESLKHVLQSPENYFKFFCLNINTGSNPYSQLPTVEQIERVQLSELKSMAQNFYFNTHSLTLTLVGDFSEEQLIEWSNLYIGNLKSTIPPSIPSPPLEIKFPETYTHTISKGFDGVVLTQLTSPIIPWDVATQNIPLILAKGYLEKKLLEKLRLEMGASYSCTIKAQWEAPLTTHATLEVLFSCDQERLERLNQTVWSALEELVSSPMEQKAFDAVQSTMQRQQQNLLQTNAYWAQAMNTQLLYQLPFDRLLTYSDRLMALKPEDVSQVMKAHLPLKERTTISLIPEGRHIRWYETAVGRLYQFDLRGLMARMFHSLHATTVVLFNRVRLALWRL
jgi:zinc protease